MLTSPADRIAAGLIAQRLREMMEPVDEGFPFNDPFAPVSHLVHLHPRDLARVKRRLKKLLAKFERDACLPERMVEWRDELEKYVPRKVTR